jgi:hypothetical protein
MVNLIRCLLATAVGRQTYPPGIDVGVSLNSCETALIAIHPCM